MYEFALSYERVAMSFQRMRNTDHCGMPILQDDEMGFQNDHPGRRYCYLKKAKKIKIPKLSMPKGMICDLEELELNEEIPSEKAIENRTNYAKIAPFQNESIFQHRGYESLWDKLISFIRDSDDSTLC